MEELAPPDIDCNLDIDRRGFIFKESDRPSIREYRSSKIYRYKDKPI